MTDTPPNTNVSKPVNRRKKRIFIPILIGIVVVSYLLYKVDKDRNEFVQKLEEKEAELARLTKDKVNEATSSEQVERDKDQELVSNILGKLRNHIIIPDFPKPTVATITDIETLKQTNAFYEPAENGDHLIITERRAILYDSDRDIILDIVPVQAEREPEAAPDAVLPP